MKAEQHLRHQLIRLAASYPAGSQLRSTLISLVAASMPIGKAKYKGKIYNLLYAGPTKVGDRAKLQFLDGSKDFWVDLNLIEKLPAGGSNGGGTGRASDAQVNFALKLIQRASRGGGWFDTDMGDAGMKPPSERELRNMSSKEISVLIDSLKD
jgi:hypothetical protein